MIKNRVTVLMCEYNTDIELLKMSIDSILNQSYKYFDFLIVNDNTCSENRELLYSYSDSRIVIIENKENIGLEKSLNVGLKNINSEYIIRMDTDDICSVSRIQKQVEFADNNPEYSIVGTGFAIFDENGIYRIIRKSGEIKVNDLLIGLPFQHSTLLLRTKSLKSIGGYPEYILCEDYAMVLAMYKENYKGYLMKDLLVKYRLPRGKVNKNQNIKNALLECRVKYKYFKSLKVPLNKQVYCLVPFYSNSYFKTVISPIRFLLRVFLKKRIMDGHEIIDGNIKVMLLDSKDGYVVTKEEVDLYEEYN